MNIFTTVIGVCCLKTRCHIRVNLPILKQCVSTVWPQAPTVMMLPQRGTIVHCSVNEETDKHKHIHGARAPKNRRGIATDFLTAITLPAPSPT